jgi:hypothetical protein
LWRGPWQNGTEYETNDAVFYEGSGCVALQNHTSDGDNAPPDAANWDPLALQGEQGDHGNRGDPGLVRRGIWIDTSTLHNEGDVVHHEGSAWVKTTAGETTTDEPSDSSTHWELLAKKGDDSVGGGGSIARNHNSTSSLSGSGTLTVDCLDGHPYPISGGWIFSSSSVGFDKQRQFGPTATGWITSWESTTSSSGSLTLYVWCTDVSPVPSP